MQRPRGPPHSGEEPPTQTLIHSPTRRQAGTEPRRCISDTEVSDVPASTASQDPPGSLAPPWGSNPGQETKNTPQHELLREFLSRPHPSGHVDTAVDFMTEQETRTSLTLGNKPSGPQKPQARTASGGLCWSHSEPQGVLIKRAQRPSRAPRGRRDAWRPQGGWRVRASHL